MRATRWLAGLAVILVALSIDSSPASAQFGCKSTCETCNPYPNNKGTGQDTPVGIVGHITECGNSCYGCIGSFASAKDREKITQLARAQDEKTVARLMKQHGKQQLLVHPSRRLLVVRGTECDPNALSAVFPVSEATVQALGNSGVGDLTKYVLASHKQAAKRVKQLAKV